MNNFKQMLLERMKSHFRGAKIRVSIKKNKNLWLVTTEIKGKKDKMENVISIPVDDINHSVYLKHIVESFQFFLIKIGLESL